MMKQKKQNVVHLTLSALIVLMLFFAFISFPRNAAFAEDDTEELKDDLKDIQKEIEDIEDEKKELEAVHGQIQNSIYTVQSAINSTEKRIEKAETEIERKEKEVDMLNKKIELQKKFLKSMVQQAYYRKKEPLLSVAMMKGDFGSVLGKIDNFKTIEDNLIEIAEEIRTTKKQVKEEKDEIEEKKEEHEELLEVKAQQQQKLLAEKNTVQKDIQIRNISLGELREKMAKIRSALSKFLGESYDTDDIVDAIKFASKQTGVRKEFLMAMLDKETDLGRFTGGCTYKDTRIRDNDKDIFKDICEELGYNYKKQKVSCALSYGYGGAMGVAQFMPSTWIGYKDAITGYTGNNPPDPWNLVDGVVGMAEKLRRAGADSKKNEHHAAKVYYCGSSRSAYWDTHCEAYADTVISWSRDGYDDFFN